MEPTIRVSRNPGSAASLVTVTTGSLANVAPPTVAAGSAGTSRGSARAGQGFGRGRPGGEARRHGEAQVHVTAPGERGPSGHGQPVVAPGRVTRLPEAAAVAETAAPCRRAP